MWRADETGCSSSRGLEGNQGKEGELDISAFLCICNWLSSWIILFPQTHSRKCSWHGRMCQCLASQGYMAKVMLPHHHLRDMTENLVKNELTCHYSKSSFIWEGNLLLGSDSTAAVFFFSLSCVGDNIYMLTLYTLLSIYMYCCYKIRANI